MLSIIDLKAFCILNICTVYTHLLVKEQKNLQHFWLENVDQNFIYVSFALNEVFNRSLIIIFKKPQKRSKRYKIVNKVIINIYLSFHQNDIL